MRLAAGCTTKTSAPYICCAILTLVLCAVYFGKSGRQTVSLDHQHIGGEFTHQSLAIVMPKVYFKQACTVHTLLTGWRGIKDNCLLMSTWAA